MPAIAGNHQVIIAPDTSLIAESAVNGATPTSDQGGQNAETTMMQSNLSTQPWVVYNARGEACAHWERCSPPLAYDYADMHRLGHLCPDTDLVGADIADVVEW